MIKLIDILREISKSGKDIVTARQDYEDNKDVMATHRTTNRPRNRFGKRIWSFEDFEAVVPDFNDITDDSDVINQIKAKLSGFIEKSKDSKKYYDIDNSELKHSIESVNIDRDARRIKLNMPADFVKPLESLLRDMFPMKNRKVAQVVRKFAAKQDKFKNF